jgi:hypothetical protein
MADSMDWGDAAGGDDSLLPAEYENHPLDSEEARKEFSKLMGWYFHEKDRQAVNRLEMATDADFYDSIQWNHDDAQILEGRGQAPLVFNEVAPMVDWVIGTERRARVDWKVLPRAEDDVELADIKTKVMKYVSDVNRSQFVRSRAFADAVKAGVGWIDDGARDDPSEDVLYSRYEDWRNVLWDSSSYEPDLSDARYVFRWRWVDLDIARMMFPDRVRCIERGAEDRDAMTGDGIDDEEAGLPPSQYQSHANGVVRASGTGSIHSGDSRRYRVRLIECQYRKPAQVQVVASGPFKGKVYNQMDRAMGSALAEQGATIIDKVMNRVHFAVFTDSDMLAHGPSIYRHNRFTLTPVWCYRFGRSRLPYGLIRRVRDIQQDLNKRASKALFMLNSNQTLYEVGAVDDINRVREEVNRPDGDIPLKPGGMGKFQIRRDTDAASGQINMMMLDAQSIQKSAGVADENLGRQTNAVSGEAIKARQLQGSVVTTEPFDNLRLAAQIQGEKQLSLVEQFYTEAKVIRLTGAKGAIEWVKVNQPEEQADGSMRFLNDITQSIADFVVSEQDYAGSLRQVMFDSMNQIAQKLPPEVALKFLRVAFEYSDLPNKDEITDELRRLTGERDPDKEPSPEEAQQMKDQAQQQAEAIDMQRKQAMLALGEQQAKIQKLRAEAQKIEAEARASGAAVNQPDPAAAQAMQSAQDAVARVQQQASAELDRVSEELRKTQSELANRTLQINREADVKVEAARIAADAQVEVATIQAASDERIKSLEAKVDMLKEMLSSQVEEQTQESEKPEEAPQSEGAMAEQGGEAEETEGDPE